MDFNRNKGYFQSSNAPRNIGIGLGIFGLILFAAGEAGFIFGILFIAGGIALFYFMDIKKRLSDSEFDQICESQVQDMRNEALSKLGLDEDEVSEAGHIQVSSYDYDTHSPSILRKQGKDGVWRTSQYMVAVLFSSQDVLHCFVRRFSVIGNETTDSIEEHFYRDITSFKVAPNVRNDQINAEYVELTKANGSTFNFAFKRADSERVTRSINAMRNLLKDKRQTMA